MFYIIRAYRYSWILLLVPVLAILYAYLHKNTEVFPKGDDKWFDSAVSTVVAAATTTLSFILSMTLSGSMNKNSKGIAMFNAFTGDRLAFGMHVLALSNDEKKDDVIYVKTRKNIRDLLLAGPGILKWSFRGKGVLIDLVQVKQNADGSSVKLSERNRAMYCALKQYSSLGGVESYMVVLANEIEKLKKAGLDGTTTLQTLISKWENLYSTYGSLGNLFGWKPPALFSWWLSVCLYIYLALMPYSFVPTAGYHAAYISFIVSYFFLGAYVGLQKLGDPFAEGISETGEFATVTAAAKTAQETIEALFVKEALSGLDDIVCELPDGAEAVQVNLDEFTERQSLLQRKNAEGMLY